MLDKITRNKTSRTIAKKVNEIGGAGAGAGAVWNLELGCGCGCRCGSPQKGCGCGCGCGSKKDLRCGCGCGCGYKLKTRCGCGCGCGCEIWTARKGMVYTDNYPLYIRDDAPMVMRIKSTHYSSTLTLQDM